MPILATVGSWILRNPWSIAIIAMTVVIGVQWTKIQYHKGQTIKAQEQVVEMQGRLGTCRGNVTTLEGGLEECIGEHGEFIDRIELMEVELQDEKKLVAYWRQMYIDKKCYNPETDVPKEGKEVLNDENNVDAINRINDIFKP